MKEYISQVRLTFFDHLSVSQILEMEFIVKFRLARLNSILNHRINLKLSEVFYMIKLPPLAARISPRKFRIRVSSRSRLLHRGPTPKVNWKSPVMTA
jgi:hypothetical protein